MKLSKSLIYVLILSFIFIFMSIFLPCSSHADYLDNWTLVSSGTSKNLYGITFGNGTFITVGDYGRSRISYDYGENWTFPETTGTTNYLNEITYGNGIFIAVADRTLDYPETIVLSSDYGLNWTPENLESYSLWGITYGNGKFVAVGGGIKIYMSNDNGLSWNSEDLETHYNLNGVAYGNSTLVAVGYSGAILTKSDSCTITYPEIETCWIPRVSGTTNHLQKVTFGNGKFVAAGMDGTILTSSDNGLHWNSETSGTPDNLWGITFANGAFVAVGNFGTILTSTDGENWTWRNSGISARLNAVAYGGSKFVAVGSNGIILLDGVENPVMLWRVNDIRYYTNIQDAYDNAVDDEIIQCKATEFHGDLTFDYDISVALNGGYDDSYTIPPSSYTTVKGTLTISKGTVLIENIVIL